MDLRTLQAWLAELGLYHGPGTGTHGGETRRAVKRFLASHPEIHGLWQGLRPRVRLDLARAILAEQILALAAAMEAAGSRPTILSTIAPGSRRARRAAASTAL